jgi:hypothetical protein
VWQGHRKLGTAEVEDGRWRASVASERLGPGPVVLHAVAEFEDGDRARSPAIALRIDPPPPARATPRRLTWGAGLRARSWRGGDEREEVVLTGFDGAGLDALFGEGERPERIELSGFLKAEAEGFHQLLVELPGRIRVEVNGERVIEAELASGKEAIAALSLAEGWHRVEVGWTPPPRGRIRMRAILAGDQVARWLGTEHLMH